MMMKRLFALLLAALLALPLAGTAVAPDIHQLYTVPGEFTVEYPLGWLYNDTKYSSWSQGNYTWLCVLWDSATCINIGTTDMRKSYKDFNLADATRKELEAKLKAYLRERLGSGKFKSAYIETVYAEEDWIPFFMARCVGSVYGKTPAQDHLYYYYEAMTIIGGMQICISCQTNTTPREDAGDAQYGVLKDMVASFTLLP